MPNPKILLLSRAAIEAQHPVLLSYLATVPPAMAIAQCEADKDAAQQVTEMVATFERPTAIVADFLGCMVVNDDGSVEPILLPDLVEPAEEPLIKLVQ